MLEPKASVPRSRLAVGAITGVSRQPLKTKSPHALYVTCWQFFPSAYGHTIRRLRSRRRANQSACSASPRSRRSRRQSSIMTLVPRHFMGRTQYRDGHPHHHRPTPHELRPGLARRTRRLVAGYALWQSSTPSAPPSPSRPSLMDLRFNLISPS